MKVISEQFPKNYFHFLTVYFTILPDPIKTKLYIRYVILVEIFISSAKYYGNRNRNDKAV